MTPMPQIEENKTVLTALAQAMKTELSATDWPKEGNVIDATFIKKLSRKAYFDMGRFGTGIVYGVEMSNAKEAIRTLNLEEEKRRLDKQGILHAIRGKQDLEEAASAYKDIDQVMADQQDLVKIEVALQPLAVVKG